MSFHTDEPFCPGCTQKLKGCHPDLDYYFYRIKDEKPDVHISDGFRNKEQQDACNARGTSKEVWPHSKHNNQDPRTGEPRSLAMDLCRRDEQGVMHWEVEYFEKIAFYLKDLDAPVKWGGEFKTRLDNPHFELK